MMIMIMIITQGLQVDEHGNIYVNNEHSLLD